MLWPQHSLQFYGCLTFRDQDAIKQLPQNNHQKHSLPWNFWPLSWQSTTWCQSSHRRQTITLTTIIWTRTISTATLTFQADCYKKIQFFFIFNWNFEALNSITGDTNSNAEVNSLNQVSKRRRKRSGNLPKKMISGSIGFVSLWVKLWITREKNFDCQRSRLCKLNKLLVTISNEQMWTSFFAEMLR